MKKIISLFAVGFFLAFLTGCKTTDLADSGHMASVEISGRDEVEIRAMTAAVFLANGYEQTGPLIFEKRGTAWDTAAYGAWSGSAVWVRMRVTMDLPEENRCVLGCDAYQLVDRNQWMETQEQKFFFEKRGDCKKLLNEIKTRLASLDPVSTNKIP
jgi:hypothetical protein